MNRSVHLATTFENELMLAARFGWRVVLVLDTVELLGERGVMVGTLGARLNVAFTPAQVRRMVKRMNHVQESASG